MNFQPAEDARHEMQIAPLIDIVFLLLVFFVATTALLQMERELNVTLPSSDSAEPAGSRLNDIVVNLTAEGAIIVNRQTLQPEQLTKRLRTLVGLVEGRPGVIIRADADCPHKYVVQVMDICKRDDVDIPNIYIGTRSGKADDAESN